MGLFKRKKEDKKSWEVSKLPELPPLPELPEIEDENSENFIHQLPRFPNDSLGEKFSQNTIKEAITGKKEERGFADEFATREEMQMMQEPPERKFFPVIPKDKIRKEISTSFEESAKKIRETEPIFIRMDKFDEGLKALEETKKQISEIEKLLKNTREIKEAEEKELEFWEKQIQNAKEQIEKIDKNIFSKIE